MIRNKARLGEHLIKCEYCGMTYYNSQIRKNWKGELVCYGPGTRHDWEPRHSVDFIRSRKDLPGVKDARPRATQDLSDAYPNGVSSSDL